MSEILEAVAESLINHVKNEDIELIETILRTVDDEVMWRDVMSYELNLSSLMSGLLESDILAPRLAIFDICTMAPLHYAALRGADVVVDLFLKTGHLPVDTVLRSGSTPLQLACFSGEIDTAILLIDCHQAKINQQDKYGWTALHYASLGGQLEAVELLVVKGADVSVRDKDGTTAAFRAQAYGREDIVSALLSATGDGDQLLIDDTPSDTVPIYSTIRKVEESIASTEFQESEYEMAVPPKLWEETDSPYHPNSDSDNVALSDNQTKVQEDQEEVKRNNNSSDQISSSTGSVTASSESPYSTLDIGNNTMTNILRDEFLKFRAQKLSSQKRKPRPSMIFDHVVEAQAERPYVNRDYEEVGVYADLMKVSEVCKMADHQISSSMPCLHDDSSSQFALSDPRFLSTHTLPSRQTIHPTPPPLPPPRSMDSIKITRPDYHSDTFDKDRLILILEKIEHDSAMMEAAFGALADKIESPDDWKALAYALPLRTNPKRIEKKIVEIEKKFPDNVRKQTVELLRQWRNYRGEAATVQNLSTAMSNSGLVNHVQHVIASSQEFAA